MKKNNKILTIILSISLILSMAEPTVTFAASTPSLGAAASFGILASTYTNTTPGTTINGDVGYTTGPAMAPIISGTTYVADATYNQAGTDQGLALAALNSEPCTFTFGGGAIDLSTDITHGVAGVYTPGVYCSAGAMNVGGPLTLSGSGTYIFRTGGALDSTAGAVVTLDGASACDIFWTPIGATTLGANTTFVGTVISNAGITVGANTIWEGQALAFGGTITTDTDTITVPICAAAPATLHVVKTVINDNGGTAVASDFNLHVKLAGIDVAGSPATGTAAPGTSYSLAAGAYVISEDANASYVRSFSGDCDASGNIVLAAGDDKTCTITNNDIAPAPATLHVVKTVINDNGGTAVASDFNLHVKLAGIDVAGSPATGTAAPGTSYSLAAGAYVISEDANASYVRSFSGDCDASGNIVLAAGDDKTCTITNNDIAPAAAILHVVKTVINDNGGTAVASDFTFNVAGTNVSLSSFAGSEAGVDVTLDAGAYEVTETSLSGYLQSGSGGCSGIIAAGETKTCTITNDDIAPQLIVNKVVVNDNGGTKAIADFPLFLDGGSVISGVASTTAIGSHTVSETSAAGYTATISGHCAANGTVNLVLGDVKTCTITNDDIAPVVVPSPAGGGGGSYNAPVPPIIDIVKVPSPLNLPDGPGTVKYTYTLRNIGTVPVSDVTMVGDTCSPITLISGDTDADAMLDVNETWIYTCSTTLSKTHTNIITATGWANGISATDIANATVIVGVPVVPPLIHVTKVPSPLVLSAGGGTVIYTNKVTNPGTVALSNVRLTDDKCDSVKYISGDTNGNSKLDITETWIYTCSANITKTTVNTVTASGEANGLTARDFAIVTVVVTAVPKLPSTGIGPSDNNTPWNVFVLVGSLAILTLFYFVQKKQTA